MNLKKFVKKSEETFYEYAGQRIHYEIMTDACLMRIIEIAERNNVVCL